MPEVRHVFCEEALFPAVRCAILRTKAKIEDSLRKKKMRKEKEEMR